MNSEHNKEDYPDLNRECLDLDALCGTWGSINGEPSIIIYKDREEYKISIIHISEISGQASPSTYEIQQDKNGYFIFRNQYRMDISFDFGKDELEISRMGIYLRN